MTFNFPGRDTLVKMAYALLRTKFDMYVFMTVTGSIDYWSPWVSSVKYSVLKHILSKFTIPRSCNYYYN